LTPASLASFTKFNPKTIVIVEGKTDRAILESCKNFVEACE